MTGTKMTRTKTKRPIINGMSRLWTKTLQIEKEDEEQRVVLIDTWKYEILSKVNFGVDAIFQ